LQGNVTTLTDSSGAVVGSYTYDAWGNTVAMSGARAGGNPYRFSTKEALGELYSFGFRFYNPGTGRWINRDPIREMGGVNLYAGMGNNPVNFIDNYGLSFWSSFGRGIVKGVIGATVVVGVAAVAVTVGVPAAVVTGTLYVAGAVGAGLTVASVIHDRSADNIGNSLGSFVGGAIVGGGSGRFLACRLSPPHNQPLPGWRGWSPQNDRSQIWRVGGPTGKPSVFAIFGDFSNAMATGPSPLSGAGSVAGTGFLPQLVEQIWQAILS